MFSSSPVVVQGTPVTQQPQQYTTGSVAQSNFNVENNNAGPRQDKVETGCNDPIFAVLLYVTVIAIAVVAGFYGPDALETEETDTVDYSGYMGVAAIIAGISFIGAGLGMALLMWIPQFLIKTSLIFSVVMAGVVAVLGFVAGNIGYGVVGAIFFALSVCYAFMVWSRIPFATANLVTACTAIRANLGVAVYAYMFALLAAGWSILWALAFVGVFDTTSDCSDAQESCNPGYGLMFLLFLAYFFVHQVLQNSIHVTVAGTVATWWYSPQESGCCTSGVNNSFIRTMTTSFGSICFGSLLVALVQALKALAQQARQNGDLQIFACIAECILGCLASIIEYFNQWAFIYVGVYGMPYLKAGKSVFELFRNRGWEAIIADNLVGNALFLVSLVVGGVMGGIGLVFEKTSDVFDDAGGDSQMVSFILGLFIGLVITSILMSTIASGVNAVIVLFAEGPNEFQQNHRELSNKMREVWSQTYPGSV